MPLYNIVVSYILLHTFSKLIKNTPPGLAHTLPSFCIIFMIINTSNIIITRRTIKDEGELLVPYTHTHTETWRLFTCLKLLCNSQVKSSSQNCIFSRQKFSLINVFSIPYIIFMHEKLESAL